MKTTHKAGQEPGQPRLLKALGVDPSSYAVGLAVADGAGDLLFHEQWLTGLQGTGDPYEVAGAQYRLYTHLTELMREWVPNVVVVEQLAVAQSLKSVRAILYFEAIAMMATFTESTMLQKPVATQVRLAVFGKGGLSKEMCAELVRNRLGKTETHLPTLRSRRRVPVFTDDEADAYALACFGVGHAIEEMP
jgi:Holliday junction resolvasome RuvABC endonuclease subunit